MTMVPANAPIPKLYSGVAFLIAALLLTAGVQRIGSGQVVPGPAIAGTLYLAFALALAQGHRLARAKHWWAAALLTGITPLGLLALIITVVMTVRLRKTPPSSGVTGT